MTIQVSDTISHGGIRYFIKATEGDGLFHPADYGIIPEPISTACFRGFYVQYQLKDLSLSVSSLTIGLPPEHMAKAFRGTLPFAPGIIFRTTESLRRPCIEGLSLPVSFTGGLLVANGYQHNPDVHMGYFPIWQHTDVRELIFEQGLLRDDLDRSDQVIEIRERLAEESPGPLGLASAQSYEWISKYFSRNYFP